MTRYHQPAVVAGIDIENRQLTTDNRSRANVQRDRYFFAMTHPIR
jgi:hypothetical protein